MVALAGCVDVPVAEEPEEGSSELLSIERGRDARLLDDLQAIPGASVRYDEAALLVYRGDAPATVEIALDAGPAWRLASPSILTLAPRGSAPIALEIVLPEGEAGAGPATLRATLVPGEPRPPVSPP